jgi:hypothetical protein
MRNNNLNRVENILFVIAMIVGSFAIVLGFLALVGKVVMSIFS